MNMMTKDRPAVLLPRAELFALFGRDAPPRDAIERAVDALIAHLDALDGDPDLEDGDADCCATERLGEAESDDGAKLLPALPRYGLDQSRGPINYRHASNDDYAARIGVVPNGRGGWRWPS